MEQGDQAAVIMNVATKLLQENSFPTVAACLCRERFEYGVWNDIPRQDGRCPQNSDQRKRSSQQEACCSCRFEWRLHHSFTTALLPDIFHNSFKNETVNDPGAIRLNLENGTYIGYTKIQQHVRTRSDQELCSMHAEQKPGGPSARSVGESPMVSVVVKLTAGPPAQSPETKLQTRQEPCSSGEMMHVENEIVDAGN